MNFTNLGADTPSVSEKVQKWMEAVEAAPTLSRLHVLLAVFETCVKWEKSAANAKCKICRKKGDDSKLLLCDECNQPFHLFCLRPALTTVPKGEWKCPACAVSNTDDQVGLVELNHYIVLIPEFNVVTKGHVDLWFMTRLN